MSLHETLRDDKAASLSDDPGGECAGLLRWLIVRIERMTQVYVIQVGTSRAPPVDGARTFPVFVLS